MQTSLRMEQIYKAFPGVVAVDKVDLEVNGGEVVALIGENGAGKSTLIKILSGAYTCDSGTIQLDGKELAAYNTREAIDYGISVIYQELNYINHMTVAENILLGEIPKRQKVPFLIDKRAMNQRARAIQKMVGIDHIDPTTPMHKLSVGEKQLIEIAKVYARNLKVLVMDEPTAALNDRECEKLFGLIEQMRSEGKAIIYISHKLDEVLRVADKVVVMRDGKRVGSMPIAETTKDKMVALMVGREIKDMYPVHARQRGEMLLEVEKMSGDYLQDVSFHLHRGEIIGFFGLMGAGCDEIVRSLFGALPATKTIRVSGKDVNIRSTKDAMDCGMAYVPAERKTEGLVLMHTVKRNATMLRLKELQKGLRFDSKLEEKLTEDWIQALRIKTPSTTTVVESLSGGNQQKVVLAKWMMNKPDILILNEPTRGIDVGAKAEIYRLIEQFCNEGLGVIIVSSEMAEILSVADRIYAVYNGEIRGEFDRNEATQERIMRKAIGE
ncbi:MAG: sugar ABC transporter ATP-binding protein [Candidatus Excrementavichristensenella sp.]